MKKYFKEQIENKKRITKEQLKQLKGRSFYSNYQVGDQILTFLEQVIDDIGSEIMVNLRLHTVVERDLDRLEKDFKYIRSPDTIPVLEKINMKRVVVESPYAGNIELNEAYGELAMHDCLVNYNESPYASHLLYTRRFVLRDEVPSDRKLGIAAGFYWRDVSEKSVFYTDLGMTEGMKEGIDDCQKKEKIYEVRKLPEDLWNELVIFSLERGITIERSEV